MPVFNIHYCVIIFVNLNKTALGILGFILISILLLLIGVIYNRQKRKKIIIESNRRRNDILYINDPNLNNNNNNMDRYHNTQRLDQNFKLVNSACSSSSSTSSGLTHSDCLIDDQKYNIIHQQQKKVNAKNQKSSPNNLISLNSYDILNNLDISIPSSSNDNNNNNNTYNRLSHIAIKNNDYQIYDDPPPPYKLSKYYPVADRLVSSNHEYEDEQSHVYENIDDLQNSNRKRKTSSKQSRGKFRSLKKNASLNNLSNNVRSNEHVRSHIVESSLLIDNNDDEQIIQPSAPNMENI
jgi:hypothetical protein